MASFAATLFWCSPLVMCSEIKSNSILSLGEKKREKSCQDCKYTVMREGAGKLMSHANLRKMGLRPISLWMKGPKATLPLNFLFYFVLYCFLAIKYMLFYYFIFLFVFVGIQLIHNIILFFSDVHFVLLNSIYCLDHFELGYLLVAIRSILNDLEYSFITTRGNVFIYFLLLGGTSSRKLSWLSGRHQPSSTFPCWLPVTLYTDNCNSA